MQLYEIYLLVQEINREILDFDSNQYFKLYMNNVPIETYIYSTSIYDTELCNIRFIKDSYVESFFIIDINNTNKLSILKWTTEVLLKS